MLTVEIYRYPSMPVIRDLVVDQSLFFKQYERIKPWLINNEVPPAWCPKGLNPMGAIGRIKVAITSKGT